ncbi:MAG: TRAP transporter small permease subunit [Pseudomonadota bacterium]
MARLALNFYRVLLALSCIGMLAAFGAVSLGIVARLVNWDIPGLDAYAGYAIAATLFFAMPATLLRGEHIRVTVVLERLSDRMRGALEWWCLAAATAVSAYLAWFALRLVWVSWSTHDVSPGADATPLWIPQLAMAIGCVGLAIAFAHALLGRRFGHEVIAAGQAAHTE